MFRVVDLSCRLLYYCGLIVDMSSNHSGTHCLELQAENMVEYKLSSSKFRNSPFVVSSVELLIYFQRCCCYHPRTNRETVGNTGKLDITVLPTFCLQMNICCRDKQMH